MSPDHRSDIALLLRGMHTPLKIDEARWERLLRIARTSALHGRLAETNLENRTITAAVRRHLLSSAHIAAYHAQLVRAELFRLAPLVKDDFPVIVLKGGAYLLQQRRLAAGRFVSDVDLLVPRANLHGMEQRLRAAGWQPARLTPYDERYYRDWSHETPPLRRPGHILEVDLHHAITPVTAALAFDPASLFERSEPIPGTPFRALAPEDQLLHACVHCFQDGDLALRVREVVDIDGLTRAFSARPAFWESLIRRARELGLQRPLWYGLHFATEWLNCPVPDAIMAGLPDPGSHTRRLMDRLVPLAMLPSDPDGPPALKVTWARRAMLSRYHWLRMPLPMLLPHLARKSLHRLRTRVARKEGAPENGAP
ncbi:MAG: nucleotidyltransferase family protein [Thauera sp.]